MLRLDHALHTALKCSRADFVHRFSPFHTGFTRLCGHDPVASAESVSAGALPAAVTFRFVLQLRAFRFRFCHVKPVVAFTRAAQVLKGVQTLAFLAHYLRTTPSELLLHRRPFDLPSVAIATVLVAVGQSLNIGVYKAIGGWEFEKIVLGDQYPNRSEGCVLRLSLG